MKPDLQADLNSEPIIFSAEKTLLWLFIGGLFMDGKNWQFALLCWLICGARWWHWTRRVKAEKSAAAGSRRMGEE